MCVWNLGDGPTFAGNVIIRLGCDILAVERFHQLDYLGVEELFEGKRHVTGWAVVDGEVVEGQGAIGRRAEGHADEGKTQGPLTGPPRRPWARPIAPAAPCRARGRAGGAARTGAP